MCFRRCRRGNFHSRCAFDVVDEMFLYSRHAFDVVDEVNFTPDVLSTLSTRQFLLPTCNPITILGFFTLWVWFYRLFRIFGGLSPPSSPPPRGCCRDGGGERISKTEVRPRGWGLFPPRLRRRNIRLWRRPR